MFACAFALAGCNAANALDLAYPATGGEVEAASGNGEAEYQRALSLNAGGKGREAMAILDSLRQRYPAVLRYRFDWIAVASASGEHGDALAEMQEGLERQAPRYVMEAWFQSALALDDEAKAEQLHTRMTERFGPNIGASIRLAHTHAKLGSLDKALAISRDLAERYPDRLDVLDLRGYVLRRADRLGEALFVYQKIQRDFPDNRDAPIAIAMILADMGAAQEAARNSEVRSLALGLEDSLRLDLDRAAQLIRWAASDGDTPSARFKNVDMAIAILTSASQKASAGEVPQTIVRRLQRDLVVAYNTRNLWKQSVAQYELLVAGGDDVPEYVSLTAASAYGSLARYVEAEAILRSLAAKNPDSFEMGIPWFYSLSDLERYDEAKAVIDDLVERLSQAVRENPAKASAYTAALITQSMASAYRDRLAEADDSLEKVLTAAPGSLDAIEASGTLANWRGHPRQAEENFRIVLGEQPKRLESRIGLASTRMDRGDAAYFRQTVDEVGADYPDMRSVREARRRLQLHDSYYVTGGLTFGGDQYSVAGNRTREFDLKTYSPPFAADSWRAFVRYRSLWSGPVVPASGDAASFGLKYTRINWSTEMEAGNSGYARLETGYTWTDQWSGSLQLEKNMFFRQARAVQAGVTADQGGLNLRWRQDEVREVAGGYRATSFSDNQRSEAYLAGSQLLLADFNKRLTLGAHLGDQRNSNPAVVYFSPSHLTEASATLTFEFMQWRDVETKKSLLRHRIWATGGQVNQAGFGSHPMSNYGYGQEIALTDAFRARWSIARTHYPFDGVGSSYYTGTITFEGYF